MKYLTQEFEILFKWILRCCRRCCMIKDNYSLDDLYRYGKKKKLKGGE